MNNNEQMVRVQEAVFDLEVLLSPLHGGNLHTEGCAICEALLKVRLALSEPVS